ncbi:MAG: flagellar basal body-associated FliL family protein [Planctomycetota bacterium]
MAGDKKEQTPAPDAAAKPPKRSKLPLIIVGSLMLGEGVAVFVLAKALLLPPPATAEGGEEHADAEASASEEHGSESKGGEHGLGGKADGHTTAEIELADCRPSNTMTGRLVTFRIHVSALVLQSDTEKAANLVKANQARINDRVNFIIRAAEPQHLKEPGLDTIKRKLKAELDRVLGEENLIKEVLVPDFLQSGPGV